MWLFLDSILLYGLKSLRSYCYASIIRNSSSWYELQKVAYRMWYYLVGSPLSILCPIETRDHWPTLMSLWICDGQSSSNYSIQAYSSFASHQWLSRAHCLKARLHSDFTMVVKGDNRSKQRGWPLEPLLTVTTALTPRDALVDGFSVAR
jgi:hypothetical protein